VVKYRKKLFTPEMEESLKNICSDIEDCAELTFHEIGIGLDRVHFLIQAIPSKSPSRIVYEVKKPTAEILFEQFPHIRDILKKSQLWTEGYYMNTVGLHSN
jgi:putative transposase